MRRITGMGDNCDNDIIPVKERYCNRPGSPYRQKYGQESNNAHSLSKCVQTKLN